MAGHKGGRIVHRRRRRRSPRKAKTCKDLLIHCQKRLSQRFGVMASFDELIDLARKIHAGEAKLICKQTNTRSVWNIELRGRCYPFVYNNKIGAVCTVLPEERGER